ncbi:olfactory receptor 4N5-like [Crassostrea angulata]|uniref:olfactory receptor 4N5-like n=1 Tax=Magallana angulata TaxID=2784310 RepID=UPI0022B1A035|nr:olfactory receptor 4N5-like [Crassostrea angulata]
MDDLNLQNHVDYPDILVVIGYLMTFSLAGSVGNAFVIYIFSRKREKSTTTVFILVLAMTDFFTCLVIIPFTIYYEVMEKRVNSNVQCKIYMFLITTNIPFSAFIMVLIAFDRYFKICRPWNQCLNIRMSKKIVIAVLLFALSLGIIPSLTHRVYPISDETSTIENNITSLVFDGDKQSAHNGTVMELNNTAYQGLIPKLDFPGNVSSNSSDNRNKYEGYCMPVLEYFSQSFMKTYQNIYASLFLISCVFVTVLYALIFKSITLRRYKKRKRAYKGMDRRTSTAITNTCTTRLTTTEPPYTDQNRRAPTNNNYVTESKRSVRNKLRLANIKTAGILFVVTIVFILAFLPAWLMSIRVIKPNIIVYYLYFSNNIANPIIYAFFNVTFRKDIRNAVHCK